MAESVSWFYYLTSVFPTEFISQYVIYCLLGEYSTNSEIEFTIILKKFWTRIVFHSDYFRQYTCSWYCDLFMTEQLISGW